MRIVFKHEWIMFMDKFVRNLKIMRLIRGLSIRQVAQKIDRTPGTISNWETGKISPDVDSVAKLCKIYDISPNELLGWDDCQLIEDFVAQKKDQIAAMEKLIAQKNELDAQIKEYMKVISYPAVDIDYKIKDRENGNDEYFIEQISPKTKS